MGGVVCFKKVFVRHELSSSSSAVLIVFAEGVLFGRESAHEAN